MAFLNDITLGQYYPADSILHRLDPRSKLLSCLLITTSLLISHAILLLGIQTLFCIVAMRVSQIPLKFFTKNLKWFFWLLSITFCIHLIDVGISGTAPFLHLSITQQGLSNGISYTLRLVLLITFASLLTMTTYPMELTDSLEKLLSPLKRFKIPVHEFALMTSLALRFIPILLLETQKIKNAQLSRGLSLEGNLLQRVQNVVPMLLPLFVSAIRRADDLAIAMQARRYTGGQNRTSFHKLELRPADGLLLLFSTSYFFVVLILR